MTARSDRSRGQPVVNAVLDATIEELASRGYQALSVDDVARRAGVARSTVYRRWPTRADLVKAAIESLPGAEVSAVPTTDARAALREAGQRVVRFLETRHGKAIMRLFAAEEADAELRETLDAIRHPRDLALLESLREARAAGSLAPDADLEMLAEVVPATLFTRAIVRGEALDDAYVDRIVNVLVPRS